MYFIYKFVRNGQCYKLTVTWKKIKMNPLEPPPGIKAMDWISVFADIWIQAFWLHEGSKGFLIE